MADQCLVENCTGEVHARGVCLPHLEEYRALIDGGGATWQSLLDEGAIAPLTVEVDGVAIETGATLELPNKGCLMPDCKRKHYSRGLCQVCYNQAWRMIKRGDLEWQMLIDRNLALPASSGGRGLSSTTVNLFDVSLECGKTPVLPGSYVHVADREHLEDSE